MLDRILQFSIHHRWLVIAAVMLAAVVGVFALIRLPIDAVPDITNNQVQINTLAPSLSPLEAERQLTFPIENALAGTPGLEYTRSLSRSGFSQITAVFRDDVDIYFARQQVAERLREAAAALPEGVQPTMGPIATGLGEIFMYTVEFDRSSPVSEGLSGFQADQSYRTAEGNVLRSPREQASYLREVQDWIIRPQLRSVGGVAGVDSIGGFVKQYQISPDPFRLIAYGLTFQDLVEAIERNNLSTGAGTIERRGEAYVVRANGRLTSPEQIGPIAVTTRAGVPIRIADLVTPGGVGIGRELRTGSASENGEEVVVGTVMMLIGSNSRTVAQAVDRRIQEIQKTLPVNVRIKPVLNRTKLVDETIATVRNNLLEGAALVIVVLFLLLGNVRAAVLCAAVIPLSMLLTASGMVRAGVSGNLMSLGAIDFGLIVDGAVITVENCLRRLSHRRQALGRMLTGEEHLAEVVSGSREMLRPSAFGQAIILTVYIPILAFGGVEGKMFRPMALTVIFALIAAFALSLTFVPAMIAVFIRPSASEREMFLIRWAKRVYDPTLRWALRLRWVVVAGTIASFGIAALLFSRLGQEFVPVLDEQDLALHAMRIPSTSLDQSQTMQFEIERAISALPEVAFVYSKTGTAELASDPMPPNVSDTFVILKPKSLWRGGAELDGQIEEKQRALGEARVAVPPAETAPGTPKEKLVRLLELTLAGVPGNAYEFTQPIQMRFNELISGVRSDVALKIYGDEFDALTASAEKLLKVLRTIPGATDVKVDQTEGLPVLNIDVNRDLAARYGLSIADIHDVLRVALGGVAAGQLYQGDRRFDIVVRLPEELRGDLDELARLPVPLPEIPEEPSSRGLWPAAKESGARFVPLGSVANLKMEEGLNQISRENGKRRVVVQANVRGRDLASFVEEARSELGEIRLPAGQWLAWGGQYENLLAAKSRLWVVVPACFVLVFVLLLAALRSWKQAALVFAAVPLGLVGGVLALVLRGMPFSIPAAIGFIALSGVAVLNALVMISCMNQLRNEGRSLSEAIIEGSLLRMRPVLMTALVASLGFLPMALARGTGAEVQRPLATVVIGGLITSTMLTLVVIPALYQVFSRPTRLFGSRQSSQT
ncbi:MAG: CusA/CzcA family heavy metal efflux RND transporter [Phycisphaerales bacterium]